MNAWMFALTLNQPWATWIAEGRKWIETRDWNWLPTYLISQRLAIHAAKRPPRGEWPEMPLSAVICYGRVVKVERLLGDTQDRMGAQCECAGKVGIILAPASIVRFDPPVPDADMPTFHRGIWRVPLSCLPRVCERCGRNLGVEMDADLAGLAYPCDLCGRVCCDRCLTSIGDRPREDGLPAGTNCLTCLGFPSHSPAPIPLPLSRSSSLQSVKGV